MSNFAKYGIAGIFAFVMFSALWGAFSSDPAQETRDAQISQHNAEIRAKRIAAAQDGVPLLVKAGLVSKIEPQNYRAYVNEQYWDQYTIDQKTTAAAALGYYIQDKNHDTLGIDIYGAHSGTKLGEWSDRNSFEVVQ